MNLNLEYLNLNLKDLNLTSKDLNLKMLNLNLKDLNLKRFKIEFEKWVTQRRRRLYHNPLSSGGSESLGDSLFRARVPSEQLSPIDRTSRKSVSREIASAGTLAIPSSDGSGSPFRELSPVPNGIFYHNRHFKRGNLI